MTRASLTMALLVTLAFTGAYYAFIIVVRGLGAPLLWAVLLTEVLMFVLVLRSRSELDLRPRGRNWIFYLLLGSVTGWLMQLLASKLAPAAGHGARDFVGPVPSLVVLLSSVLMAPLLEESFFRDHLRSILHELSAHRRSVFCAIAFALFHLDPMALPHTFVAGLMLGAIREKGTLFDAIAFHTGFNACGVASAWFGTMR